MFVPFLYGDVPFSLLHPYQGVVQLQSLLLLFQQAVTPSKEKADKDSKLSSFTSPFVELL
jgi:hypothetical protein